MAAVTTDKNGSDGEASAGYPPRAYAFFVIVVLMIATAHSQLDKQFPGLMVAQIRDAFDISDTQFSLFQGAAFALFYAFMGPVFGRMIDTRNRRNLIIFGILFWSTMTVAAGFATNYWQLLLTRVGVGIGEAVLAPAAYSMIADYVEPRIRGRAMGIYMAANAVGTALSLFLGGLIVGAVSHGTLIDLPLMRDMAPWQTAFVLVGLPGFVTAAMMLVAREPTRQAHGSNIKLAAKGVSAEFFAYIRQTRVAFGCVLAAQVLVHFVGNCIVPWLPTVFIRGYGMAPAQVGVILGICLFTGSVIGFFLSGWLSDRWVAKGRPDARLLPLFVGYLIFIPAVIIWPLCGNLWVAFPMFTIQCIGHVMAVATLPMTTQDIVPARMRGQAVTLVLLITTLLGWAVGPTAVALVTDYVFHDDNALPYSLVLTTVPAAALALLVAWIGRRAYLETRARVLGEPLG